MNVYAQWVEDRCKERGIRVSKLCADIGVRQSFFCDLKHGRTNTLPLITAAKLAVYFGEDLLALALLPLRTGEEVPH